ncbi:MAG: lamin tail domain-containing protein [Candidatus Cryptobacteroides sp.]
MKHIFLPMAAIAALAVVSCVKDERDPNALIPEEKPEAPVTLLINELDPNNKKLEFFNNGTEEISLKGCYMIKDGTDRWEFPDVKVAPKGIIVYTASSTDPKEGPEFGMSPTKGFKMELFDKNDKALDIVDNSKDSEKFFEFEKGIDPVQTLGRKTDGDPQWVVFCPGSIGESNAKGTFIHNWGEVPKVGKLVLNELNGNDKYIEFLNIGDADVDLEGWNMYKDESETPNWTGQKGMKVAPGEYYVLQSVDINNPSGDETYVPDFTKEFDSGLSAKKGIKIELKNEKGEQVDIFVRGETIGAGLSQEKTLSYSRVPDGTGEFVYAEPTRGSKNGEKVSDIPQI